MYNFVVARGTLKFTAKVKGKDCFTMDNSHLKFDS